MSCVDYYFDSIRKKEIKAPLSLQFEISNHCVAKCITCNIQDQKIDCQPSADQFVSAIEDLAKSGTRAIRLTGGEPIISPAFNEIVDACLRCKISTSITTTLLTKDQSKLDRLLKLKRIKVSLPVINDNYEKFFRIDKKYFYLVKRNIEFLRKNKKRFSINYTIFNENYQLPVVEEFIEFINQFSPFYVTFFPAIDFDLSKCEKDIIKNFETLAPKMKFKSNAKTIAKHFSRRKPRQKIICHSNKFTAHIKRNGDVYPCCLSGGEVGQKLDKFFLMGNIFQESIADIYKAKYGMFENLNLAKNVICMNCTQRYLKLNTDYEGFLEGGGNFKEV